MRTDEPVDAALGMYLTQTASATKPLQTARPRHGPPTEHPCHLASLNPLMLLGLAALAIPPIIHLLNRRRFDVVDWGAMQFLQISEITRRRLLIEELLLMLLRMGLIALLVAGPGRPLSPAVRARLSWAARPNRDVVLVFDGSSSMSYTGSGKTPHDAAKEWATDFLEHLAPGDSVAILQAKQQVVPVLAEPSHDLATAPARPSSTCRRRRRLRLARGRPGGLRRSSARASGLERDIIVLSDGQKFGWADATACSAGKPLARQLGGWQAAGRPAATPPRLWVRQRRPPTGPPIRPTGRWRRCAPTGPSCRSASEVTFRTDLELRGQNGIPPPYSIRLEVDGKRVSATSTARLGRRWSQRQGAADLHAPPSPRRFAPGVGDRRARPAARTAAGRLPVKDHLPGDNRQDFAVEVLPALPVLIVDGDAEAEPPRARHRLAPRRPVAAARRRRRSSGPRRVHPGLRRRRCSTGDFGKEPDAAARADPEQRGRA